MGKGRERGPGVTVLKAWPKTGKDGKTPGGRPLTGKAAPAKDEDKEPAKAERAPR